MKKWILRLMGLVAGFLAPAWIIYMLKFEQQEYPIRKEFE